MPSRKYKVLIGNQRRDLEVKWRGMFKDLILLLEGSEIGKVQNKKELKKGVLFHHSSGEYSLKLVTMGFQPDFDILHNGEPVGGSSKDPAARIKAGLAMIMILGFFNIAAGVLSVSEMVPFLSKIGVGWYNIIIAVLYGASWGAGKYFNKLAGLVAGLSVFAMDTFFAVTAILAINPQSIGGTIVMRLFFCAPIFLGMLAAFKARKSLIEDGELKYEKEEERLGA